MRIQNTINSIANAICRFCAKGLTVLRISSLLQRRSWHLLPQCVGLVSDECSRVNSHVMGMLRNLTVAVAQVKGGMDANLECYLKAYQFVFCPCAATACKPATLEACMVKPGAGSPGNSYRNPC